VDEEKEYFKNSPSPTMRRAYLDRVKAAKCPTSWCEEGQPTAIELHGKEISATEAKQEGIKSAECKGCGTAVRLHFQGKPTGPADHFEHPGRFGKDCSLLSSAIRSVLLG
jgi:hypothetical protein